MSTLAHEAPATPVDDREVPIERIHDFDLSFMEPDAMDRLRAAQKEPVFEAGKLAVQSLSPEEVATERGDEVRDEARREAVRATVEEHISSQAPHAWFDSHPELHERFADIIGCYSHHNMSAREWQRGLPADLPHSDSVNQRPGRERLEEELEALRSEYGVPDTEPEPEPAPAPEPEPEPEPAPSPYPTHETLVGLADDLESARNALAEVSMDRRRLIRKKGRKAEKLEAKYEKARTQYDAANRAYSIAQAQRWRAGRNEDDETIEVPDDTTLYSMVVDNLLEEHQAFSQSEFAALARDDSRRARLAQFLIRHRLFQPANFGSGIAVGMGTRLISRSLLAGAIGVTGAAGLGIGLAVKTTRAVYAANIGNEVYARRHFDKKFDKDNNELAYQLGDVRKDHASLRRADNDVISNAHSKLLDTIDHRVEKDRKSNRNRVIGSAVVGAAGGLVGDWLASGFDHPHAGGGLGTHHSHTPGSGSHEGNGSGGHHGHGGSHHPKGGQHNHHPQPGEVDGFQTHVQIGNGEGYEHALSDLASQKGIHLGGDQSWALYQHLDGIFHGNFLTNDPSYHMHNAGQWGISHPGPAHWDPAVVREMNEWLNNHDIHGSVAHKAGRIARRAARTQAV